MKRRVGLIGCGAIGRTVAAAFRAGKLPGRLVAVCDLKAAAAERLAQMLTPKPSITSLPGVIRASDVVMECAHADAVPAVVREALEARRDLVIMSVSGLLRHPRLIAAARRSRSRLVVPSGALGGLDALRAAAVAGLKAVTLVTRKRPQALQDAPYLKARGITLAGIKRPRVVYTGNAAGAARGFPSNLNVAATVSLAGLGPRATRVTIIADPALRVNVHELLVKGEFGQAMIRVRNKPSPDNPRTSHLAALSAIAALRCLLEGVSIGG